jgi:hypothetical protein
MDIKNNFKVFLNKLNFRLIIEQSLALCAMIILTVFTVSYANQEFEIPFFPRDAESHTVAFEITRNTERDNTAEVITEVPSNINNIINPEDLIAEAAQSGEEPNSEPEFEALSDLMSAGFAVTDGMYEPYNEDKINGRKAEIRQLTAEIRAATAENEEEPDFSGVPGLYEYKFAKVTPERQPINAERTDAGLPAVEPVMDYLLIRNGDAVILCDASGKIIDANFAASGIEILRMRDWDGRTVFRKPVIVDTPEGPAGQIEYLIYNGRAFEPIAYIEEWGNRGAAFMYPSSYGARNNNWAIFKHTNNFWGYQSTVHANQTVAAQYHRAFNFSENIAAAYITTWTQWSQLGNRLYFHDTDGRVINRDFYAPDPIDEETNHLGFYYFDHGLTRVISKQVNRAGTSATEQREHLVDKNWQEFYTPGDYKIMAYSNGMILLEKDGNYGFMNYLGEWVAQPIYTYAEPFYEGVAVLGIQGGKKMLIDTQGNRLTNMQYDYISNCTGGIAALYEQGAGWTILSKVRREIVAE